MGTAFPSEAHEFTLGFLVGSLLLKSPVFCHSNVFFQPLSFCPFSFGHYILSSMYGFWLPLWYLVAIVLSVLLCPASDYPFGISWPLYSLSFYVRLLITPLVSRGHCIVCPSMYGFWLPLWYLVAIVLSVLLCTASDYPFGISWPLHCLSYVRLLITPLVSRGHCIVCPSMYGFWLPLWYLVVIVLSVLLCTASDYPFGIFNSIMIVMSTTEPNLMRVMVPFNPRIRNNYIIDCSN